jgi:site-specific DNA-methyltransferase (adenine-specific)
MLRRTEPRCRLYNDDCLQRLATFADRSVHAVLTDPPYGSTDCHWDRKFDLRAWWEQIDRVTTETAVVACFAAQPFATDLINSNRRQFRFELVWDKLHPVGFLNANRQPMRVHELLLVFCRRPGGSIYNPQKTPGKPYTQTVSANRTSVYRHHGACRTVNTGDRHPTSILRYRKPTNKERRHPTEKPLLLCEWMVKSWSRKFTTVLDPFMGSAGMGEAALMHGRRFIGIERDPAIFEVASKRLLPLLDGRSKVLLDRGKP